MNPKTKVLCLSLAAGLAVTPLARSQVAADPGLAKAQATLEEGIRSYVRLDELREELVLEAQVAAPALTAPFTLDVQWGSGHGGSLTMTRFRVAVDSVSVEELAYDRGGRDESPSWSARRTTLEPARAQPLVDLVRALARTQVSARRKPDAPLGARSSGSTNDFFVLARVMRPEQPTIEREYCGYAGSESSLKYAGTQVVVNATRALLKEIEDWSDVPEESLRKTHFTTAFNQNAALMRKDFHWWVMERSVEALGVFGSRKALDTLRQLDELYENPQPRQRNKIRNLLALPEHYLSGPPQEVPETSQRPASGR